VLEFGLVSNKASIHTHPRNTLPSIHDFILATIEKDKQLAVVNKDFVVVYYPFDMDRVLTEVNNRYFAGALDIETLKKNELDNEIINKITEIIKREAGSIYREDGTISMIEANLAAINKFTTEESHVVSINSFVKAFILNEHTPWVISAGSKESVAIIKYEDFIANDNGGRASDVLRIGFVAVTGIMLGMVMTFGAGKYLGYKKADNVTKIDNSTKMIAKEIIQRFDLALIEYANKNNLDRYTEKLNANGYSDSYYVKEYKKGNQTRYKVVLIINATASEIDETIKSLKSRKAIPADAYVLRGESVRENIAPVTNKNLESVIEQIMKFGASKDEDGKKFLAKTNAVIVAETDGIIRTSNKGAKGYGQMQDIAVLDVAQHMVELYNASIRGDKAAAVKFAKSVELLELKGITSEKEAYFKYFIDKANKDAKFGMKLSAWFFKHLVEEFQGLKLVRNKKSNNYDLVKKDNPNEKNGFFYEEAATAAYNWDALKVNNTLKRLGPNWKKGVPLETLIHSTRYYKSLNSLFEDIGEEVPNYEKRIQETNKLLKQKGFEKAINPRVIKLSKLDNGGEEILKEINNIIRNETSIRKALHDLNNPLTVIKGWSKFIMPKLSSDEEKAYDLLQKIEFMASSIAIFHRLVSSVATAIKKLEGQLAG